jgi:hypothetical protein
MNQFFLIVGQAQWLPDTCPLAFARGPLLLTGGLDHVLIHPPAHAAPLASPHVMDPRIFSGGGNVDKMWGTMTRGHILVKESDGVLITPTEGGQSMEPRSGVTVVIASQHSYSTVSQIFQFRSLIVASRQSALQLVQMLTKRFVVSRGLAFRLGAEYVLKA